MLVLLCGAPFGHQIYANSIPNGANVKDCFGNAWDGVGHERAAGGGPRNLFGDAFQAAGYSWTNALCNADSDGDGVTNGVELGDPSCTWTSGTTPQFTTGITHPGLNCNNLACDGSQSTAASTPLTPQGCDAYSGATTGSFDVTFSGHTVGAGTTYVKGAFEWPETFTGGVLKFEVINENPNVVHHMLLFKCDSDQSGTFDPPAEGNSMGCTQVINAWAVGGADFCAPPGLSFNIEPSHKYLLLGASSVK